MIGAMPNPHPELRTESEHRYDLPRMCPHSGNPCPGSVLRICYTAADWFIEIESLGAYIDSYIGGRVMGGNLIRDMEQTVQQVALDCAAAIGVPVLIVADLKIADDPSDRTRVRDYCVKVIAP